MPYHHVQGSFLLAVPLGVRVRTKDFYHDCFDVCQILVRKIFTTTASMSVRSLIVQGYIIHIKRRAPDLQMILMWRKIKLIQDTSNDY